RFFAGELLLVDRVEGRVIRQVGEMHQARHHVVKRGAGRLEECFDVAEGLHGLVGDVFADHLPGLWIEAALAGEEDPPPTERPGEYGPTGVGVASELIKVFRREPPLWDSRSLRRRCETRRCCVRWVGNAVAESQEGGPGQYQRNGAAPPDGVGGGSEQRTAGRRAESHACLEAE